MFRLADRIGWEIQNDFLAIYIYVNVISYHTRDSGVDRWCVTSDNDKPNWKYFYFWQKMNTMISGFLTSQCKQDETENMFWYFSLLIFNCSTYTYNNIIFSLDCSCQILELKIIPLLSSSHRESSNSVYLSENNFIARSDSIVNWSNSCVEKLL